MNLEGVLIDVLRKVQFEFGGDWDDLYQQAYLIALENIESYDKTRGAKLKTYLYHRVYGGLRDYCRRVVMKENVLNGRRVSISEEELLDVAHHQDLSADAESKNELVDILKQCSEGDRNILQHMYEGYTPKQTAELLGVSKQYVSKRLKLLREVLGERR